MNYEHHLYTTRNLTVSRLLSQCSVLQLFPDKCLLLVHHHIQFIIIYMSSYWFILFYGNPPHSLMQETTTDHYSIILWSPITLMMPRIIAPENEVHLQFMHHDVGGFYLDVSHHRSSSYYWTYCWHDQYWINTVTSLCVNDTTNQNPLKKNVNMWIITQTSKIIMRFP